MECVKCGYEWQARRKNSVGAIDEALIKACPRCKTRLDAPNTPESIKNIALEISEIKPDEPNFMNLVRSIETALNAYLAAHPSTPIDMVVWALRDLAVKNEAAKRE